MKDIKTYLNEKITELRPILKEVEHEYELAKTRHSQIEKIIVDIEHEIELDSLSGAEMMKKYKELQTAFRLRRIYKDSVDMFVGFRNGINISDLNSSEKEFNNIINTKTNRRYKHRIDTEVRKEILSEFNKLND